MKYLFSGFLLMILFGSLPVQRAGLSAQSLIGKLNPFPSSKESFRTNQQDNSFADDTLRILAIMVSFQEDADGTTFGNGKFGSIYSQNYGNDILDPLPHDKQYFESHLQFTKNYFHKVSKGKLEIEYTVLPDTFSVSDRMRNFSPAPGSNDFTPIGNFAVEAWTKADQLNPGFNFSNYDVFLIFHAGVGRDVTLPGSIGNERDLPSVYLSENAFKDIYGNDFEGIPVMGGSFNITNSMIIPETESRELETITGSFLFEITINGLICASIGSHIGLPDLFDTETGLSAIGRFGLMDGQSIFAYNGCYPPEPSPWSKIRLGWAEPVTVDIQNANINLVTDLAATLSDTVILKVPLNSSEYYLIENRSRDANNDGSTVTYINNGVVQTKTFLNDTTGYQSFDVDSLSGVITDVDEFDWAVPGNGIVIWHIDENVINEKIAENKVNTDKNRRGVDVEEADGVQEIGEQFTTIFGDVVVGEGSQADFWYASNPAVLFQNRFAKDTRPNTHTNSGANSLITIKDFSDISNRMNFKVEFGDSVVKPLFSYEFQSAPVHISTVELNGVNYFIFILSDNSVQILRNENLIYQHPEFSSYKPAVTVENNTLYVFDGLGSNLNYLMTDGNIISGGHITVSGSIITPCAINKLTSGEHELWFGTSESKIYKYNLGVMLNTPPELIDSIVINDEFNPFNIAVNGGYYSIISYPKTGQIERTLVTSSPDKSLIINNESPANLALTKDKDGKYITVVYTQQGFFHIISQDEITNSFSSTTQYSPFNFALVDLNRDGSNYIASNSGSELVCYNLTGSIADNFPISYDTKFLETTFPVSADFEGDSNSEVLSVARNGNLYAVDGGTGKSIPGFPISLGDTATATPSIFNQGGKTGIIAANAKGIVKAWIIGSIEGQISWKEEFADNENTSFIPAAENTNRINEFFPANRAYNYPNPVYEGLTNIRYYVAEDSKINIKIFDLAGDYVAELNDNAQGGMDNETVWDVTNIQSGVYFARIEASSTSGKTEQAVIKIAVVK